MTAQNLKVSRGEVIVFTSGEYSDFGLGAFLVAVENIDLALLAQKYCAEYKPTWDGDTADHTEFGTWLVAQGLAMPVQHREIWIGSYGRWADEFGIGEPNL